MHRLGADSSRLPVDVVIWDTYLHMGLATMLVLCLYVGYAAKQGMLRDMALGLPLNPTQLAYLFAGMLVLIGLLWPLFFAILLKLYNDSDGDWKG